MQERPPVTGTILDIFLGTLLVSAAALTLLVTRMGLDPTWRHAVLAVAVPVLALPFWAIPLASARRQAKRLAAQVELLAAIAPRAELPPIPRNGELAAATMRFERAVHDVRRTAKA